MVQNQGMMKSMYHQLSLTGVNLKFGTCQCKADRMTRGPYLKSVSQKAFSQTHGRVILEAHLTQTVKSQSNNAKLVCSYFSYPVPDEVSTRKGLTNKPAESIDLR